MRKRGFTLLEVLLVLAIVSSLGTILFQIIKMMDDKKSGILRAKQLLEFANAGSRYISIHQSLLFDSLFDSNGKSNGAIVYIPTSLLKDEGVLAKTYSSTNKQHQIPCLAITAIDNQLYGFAFYKVTSHISEVSDRILREGALSIGSAMGIYESNQVGGIGRNWKLQNADSILNGSGIPLPNGLSSSSYSCAGNIVPNKSYVISLANLPEWNTVTAPLNIKNINTNHDDTTTDPSDPKNYNTIQTGFNMYDYESNISHDVVFKLPQNCEINPDNPTICMNGNPYSKLSLSLVTNNEAKITGFVQDSYSSENNGTVGNLKVQAYQPTTKIEIGTACTKEELGTEAMPDNTNDPQNVNNLFISKVKCVASPLCRTTQNLCYLPLNGVTITYKITNSSSYSSSKYTCPSGTFVAGYTYNPEPVPNACKGNNDPVTGSQPFSCHIDPCSKGGGSCSDVAKVDSLTTNQYVSIYQSVQTTPSRWYQGCPQAHSGCNEGWGQVSDTYRQITSITCSNDSSRMDVVVNQ